MNRLYSFSSDMVHLCMSSNSVKLLSTILSHQICLDDAIHFDPFLLNPIKPGGGEAQKPG